VGLGCRLPVRRSSRYVEPPVNDELTRPADLGCTGSGANLRQPAAAAADGGMFLAGHVVDAFAADVAGTYKLLLLRLAAGATTYRPVPGA